MTEHDICRNILRDALTDMQKGKRRVRAEVTGDCRIANSHHFWVKVTDTLPLVGSRLPTGGPGHARFVDYEVEACCRWAAKIKALDAHRRQFDDKRTTEDGVLALFQKDGPSAIAWEACAPRCDCCGKRRNTYQLKPELDFYSNDRLCSECLIRQACAERQPPPQG